MACAACRDPRPVATSAAPPSGELPEDSVGIVRLLGWGVYVGTIRGEPWVLLAIGEGGIDDTFARVKKLLAQLTTSKTRLF